jgi:hypothetical protein
MTRQYSLAFKQKVIERGAHALSDAELQALLRGSGVGGCSAVSLVACYADQALTQPCVARSRWVRCSCAFATDTALG